MKSLHYPLILLLSTLFTTANKTLKRDIYVINNSDGPIDVYWVDAASGELISQYPDVAQYGSVSINTYIGHRFHIKEVCDGDEKCREVELEVTNNEGQVFDIQQNITVKYTDEETALKEKSDELLEKCSERTERILNYPTAPLEVKLEAAEDMISCLGKELSDELWKDGVDIEFQKRILDERLHPLVDEYICSDETVNTTQEWRNYTWEGRHASIMHDSDHSELQLIRNFISDEECRAMELEANKKYRMRDTNEILQVQIQEPGNQAALIRRRIFDFAKSAGLDFDPAGQEPLLYSLMREGYSQKPKCNGDCSGRLYEQGKRVASILIFCSVPEKGGLLHFRNARVQVLPQRGSALCISNIGSRSWLMDVMKNTEYLVCPVVEGEGRVLEQNIRMGVSEEKPWDYFARSYQEEIAQ